MQSRKNNNYCINNQHILKKLNFSKITNCQKLQK